MPRFYFHLLNDVDAADAEGTELPDLYAARERARAYALFTAGEALKENGHLTLSHRIQIEDAHGEVLDTVYFSEVVTIHE